MFYYRLIIGILLAVLIGYRTIPLALHQNYFEKAANCSDYAISHVHEFNNEMHRIYGPKVGFSGIESFYKSKQYDCITESFRKDLN
ncbi:MAG: hypothetical protein KW793_04250 [Candidatus Doudnabacteria bacterium]|nr:hypothetical protein [Candidatus Doudnabacteria bacterium]